MVEVLIGYDAEGHIIYQSLRNGREPVEVTSLKVDVPNGKYASSVDISGGTPKVVFEDLPKTELELLKEQQELMQKALDDVILRGGTL